MKIKYVCNKNELHTHEIECFDFPKASKPCNYSLFDCNGTMYAQEL